MGTMAEHRERSRDSSRRTATAALAEAAAATAAAAAAAPPAPPPQTFHDEEGGARQIQAIAWPGDQDTKLLGDGAVGGQERRLPQTAMSWRTGAGADSFACTQDTVESSIDPREV